MACNHKSKKKILSVGNTSLFQCVSCLLVLNDKYKQGFNPTQVYNNYYRNEVTGRFLFGIEYIVRFFRFIRALRVYTISPKAKSILDIGSGRGFMLYYLKKYYRYKTATGTQIEKTSYEFSKNKLGLEIYNKDLLDIPFKGRYFDLVTIWHVLEHVPRPEEYVIKIRQLLKTDGALVVEVPNFNSWTRVFTNKYWLGLDLNYHLFFFNKNTLSTLLKKYGFKIKRVQTFSLEYSAFTSAQSIVSLITKTNHAFFNWIQTGKFAPHIVLHAILFAFLFPPCLLINLLLYFSGRGEVLLIIAQKSAYNPKVVL